MKKKKSEFNLLKIIGKILLFIIKIPYYIVKGILVIISKTKETIKKKEVEDKRSSIKPKFEDLKVIETKKGDYDKWLKKLYTSDSQIGIILGSRGSGKTALGIKLLENIYFKKNRKCFALGFKASEFPSWIRVVEDISQIENDSYVLIDEGGILFNSRNAMSKPNKILSQLMLIARHKNLNIIFISQNSSNLEINILRQADYLLLKHSALLQKEFERKIVQKIYEKTESDFKKYSKDDGLTYIHSEDFLGFVSNPLPSFWKEEISKSFKN